MQHGSGARQGQDRGRIKPQGLLIERQCRVEALRGSAADWTVPALSGSGRMHPGWTAATSLRVRFQSRSNLIPSVARMRARIASCAGGRSFDRFSSNLSDQTCARSPWR